MQTMNYNQLKRELFRGKIYNFYFLQGEEDIIEYFETNIKDMVLGKNINDFDLTIFNGENLDFGKLYVSMENLPFKSEKKCIVIHNLPIDDWNAEQLDDFIKIMSDIPEYVCFIISQYISISGAKNVAKLKKIQKQVSVEGIFANFSKEDICIERELIVWAKNDYNKTLSLEYAQKIKKSFSEYNIRSLKNELKKICEFEKSEFITEDTLNMFLISKEKYKVFDLPKAILARDSNRAFKILNSLLDYAEEPTMILGAISSEYIDIYRVKCYLDSGRKLSNLIEIYDYSKKEFRIKNAIKWAKKSKIERIKLCLRFIMEADKKLKSGQLKPKFILSQLIAKLMIYG